MSTPDKTEPTPKTDDDTGKTGKTAKELQQEPPPPGQDKLPPTDPAGEPQLA